MNRQVGDSAMSPASREDGCGIASCHASHVVWLHAVLIDADQQVERAGGA
jgi:hypothetical protein